MELDLGVTFVVRTSNSNIDCDVGRPKQTFIEFANSLDDSDTSNDSIFYPKSNLASNVI